MERCESSLMYVFCTVVTCYLLPTYSERAEMSLDGIDLFLDSDVTYNLGVGNKWGFHPSKILRRRKLESLSEAIENPDQEQKEK